MPLLKSPNSISHAGIYWLAGNATTSLVIFHKAISYSATVAV